MMLKHAFAEFVGVFALMFVGGGAIIVTQGQPAALIAVALAHGLILSTMVCATMHSSGGQFNPAVSLALALIGKQAPARAVIFIVAQLLGACAAAFLLDLLLSDYLHVNIVHLGATIGSLTTQGATAAVFALEAIATFFLMFVILGSAADSRSATKPAAGFAIGLTVAAVILCIGPLTGASMNPARSFGPALFTGAWVMHWVYWVAPIAGAAAAAILYKGILGFGETKA
jgi:MIP family channel proteins